MSCMSCAQHVGQRVRSGVGDRLAGEQLGHLVVALGHRLVGEAERRRRGDDHRVPVRHERVVVGVAGRLVLVLEARDRIRARVRDVHARRAEADARHRRGEHHHAARLEVVGVGDGAAQEAPAVLERLRRPHVGDRVRALVGRAVVGRRGPLAAVVRAREVRLGRVADTSSPVEDVTSARQRARSSGSTMPWRRAQVAVRDAVLTFCSGMSSTATVVASAPVPDVVGIARCGFSGDGGFGPRRPAG